MKRLILSITCFCLLQACASYSPYHPASNRGYGYSETQLSDTQYRIDFKAREIERGKAVNYAMLRAAELTLEKGFDWFEVVDRQSDKKQPRMSSGIGFGIAQHQSMGARSSFGMGFEFGDRDRSEADVLLEIIMGKGVRPDVKQVYSANTLAKNLRKALAMPASAMYD
ncbi:MAG: hypothetical protein ACI9OH_001173 [Oleispira sp.]|jgi:hypothetical protein